MSLTLYYHPLASYCWKALIALYEAELPFEKRLVNLMDPRERAAFRELSPFGRFPLLRDGQRLVPESSILVEYLAAKFPSAESLLPNQPEAALRVRERDRIFDLYVHESMTKIVGDKLRPRDATDSHGVLKAHELLDTAYGVVEAFLADADWAAGPEFTLADCAAAPALHYANRVHPLGAQHPRTRAYLARLERRPSFARVLEEAEPHMANFPG